MRIALRPARAEDFDYCRRLYFAEMKKIIEQLRLNRASQEASFQEQWEATQVRIITLDDCDIGWLQSFPQEDVLFIAQLFVDGPFQRRGIGTEVMNRLIAEATRAKQAVRLSVVKINPAGAALPASRLARRPRGRAQVLHDARSRCGVRVKVIGDQGTLRPRALRGQSVDGKRCNADVKH